MRRRTRRQPWRALPRGRRRAAALVLPLLLLASLLASCGGSRSPAAASCRVGADLVPTCGALLGVTPPQPDATSLKDTEQAAGRAFDLVYTFHDLNDVIPSPFEQGLVDDGYLLHIDIDARIYGGSDTGTITWRAVADGAYDSQLTAQAQGIAGLHAPVFVTFDHEPNQPDRSALGTPSDYVAAWRHVHDVFARAGATNVVWVWVVTSWPPSLPTALQMWPGNDDVDWISWDAYNSAGCRDGSVDPGSSHTFGQVALPFLRWIRAEGPAAGIDVGKPMMISETGTQDLPTDPAAQAAWFRGMASTVADTPQIKAVALWDHESSSAGCDFRFSDRPGALASLPWTSPTAPAR